MNVCAETVLAVIPVVEVTEIVEDWPAATVETAADSVVLMVFVWANAGAAAIARRTITIAKRWIYLFMDFPFM
jgi:hypothetical protein